MKKGKKVAAKESKAQTGKAIKQTNQPVKNAMTGSLKNIASKTIGLNQTRTSRDDLFPSDGDNLTN